MNYTWTLSKIPRTKGSQIFKIASNAKYYPQIYYFYDKMS